MSRHDDATKARALAAMRTSAKRTPDGTPNFTRLSSELGIARRTLRAWWAEATGKAAPPAARPAPSVKAKPTSAQSTGLELTPEALAWAADQLGLEDIDHRDVRAVAELRVERDATTTPTARSAGNVLLFRTLLELRRPAKSVDGPTTPDEWVELVRQMPEVLLAAWLASPELWDDERWTTAQEGT